MPRGAKVPKAKTEPIIPHGKYAPSEQGEVEWGGYINIRIDEETKLVYGAWLEGDGASFWALLEDAMAEGLKYGVSWDASNECYIATLTGNGMVGFNVRCCLSSRSSRFEDATALLMFKHVVMCEGNWGNFRPSTGKTMNWG